MKSKFWLKILVPLTACILAAQAHSGTLQFYLPAGGVWHVYSGIQGDGLDEVYLDSDFESGTSPRLVTIDFTAATDQAWNNGVDVFVTPISGSTASSGFGIGAGTGMSKTASYIMSDIFGSPGSYTPGTYQESSSSGLETIFALLTGLPSTIQGFFVGAVTVALAFAAVIFVVNYVKRAVRVSARH